MKIEVTPNEAAALYIGKAVALLDTACSLKPFCDGCLLKNIETGKCMVREVKKLLEINSQ